MIKIGGFQLLLSLIILATVVGVGIVGNEPMAQTLMTAAGVIALVWLRGAIEGGMILLGMMRHDGEARPLR